MPAVYDKFGLKFLYPENWTLIDESDHDSPHIITLETPDGGGTWSVHAYPTDADRDVILKDTISGLRESYEDLEIAPVEAELMKVTAEGVEALFFCLDFLVRARLVTVTTDEHLLMFWSQAEDREYDSQEPVFNAISISLLQSLGL